jgi:hypothetical protein
MESKNKTWPQYLAVLTALLAMFCSGIHMGWPSPSLPRLFSEEYPFEVSAEAASYITIIGAVGDIFGNIFSFLLVDYIGRKATILLIGVPQIVSMTMIYLSSYSIVLLYVARFIGGISEGACFTILPIYICEVAEPRIRGLLGASFSLSLILGVLTANIVGSYYSIYTSAVIFLACSAVFLVLFSFMPESPFYLIMKNRIQESRSSLQKLRASKTVEAELDSLVSDVTRQMCERGRFSDLVTIKSNKMAVIVMAIRPTLVQRGHRRDSSTVGCHAHDGHPSDLHSACRVDCRRRGTQTSDLDFNRGVLLDSNLQRSLLHDSGLVVVGCVPSRGTASSGFDPLHRLLRFGARKCRQSVVGRTVPG